MKLLLASIYVFGIMAANQALAESKPCQLARSFTCSTPGPQGPAGPMGPAGNDGQDGVDGSSFAYLQTRTPEANQLTGAIAVGGSPSVDSLAIGLRYGLTDDVDIYGVVGHTRSGDTSWAVGMSFTLN